MSEDDFVPKVLILYSELEKLKKLASLGRKSANQEGFGMDEDEEEIRAAIVNSKVAKIEDDDERPTSPQVANVESDSSCGNKSDDDNCPEIEVSKEDSDKAEKILSALCEENSIQWSSNGEITIDGEKISGSSLALLVQALFRKDPVGLSEFKAKLTSLGLI